MDTTLSHDPDAEIDVTSALLRLVAILTTLFTIGSPVIAGSLPKPEGEPILAVSGNIAHTNDGDHALFDISMLEGMIPLRSLRKVRSHTGNEAGWEIDAYPGQGSNLDRLPLR